MKNKRGFAQVGILVLAVIASLLAGFLGGRTLSLPVGIPGISNQPISPNVLLLTQPVTMFSGIVDSVEGNAVWVSQNIFQQVAAAPNIKPSGVPSTPQTKTLTYKVLVTSKTQITKQSNTIFYYFKETKPTNQSQNISIESLKKGQSVSISTTSDLRTLSGNQFEASSIQIQGTTTTINGKITDVNNDSISLKGTTFNIGAGAGVNSQTPKEETYTITVTNDTEISQMGQAEAPKSGEIAKPVQPKKLSLSDLTKDMQINVYTEGNPSETKQLTALSIQVMPAVQPAAAGANPATPGQAGVSPAISPSVSPSVSPVVSPKVSVTPLPASPTAIVTKSAE